MRFCSLASCSQFGNAYLVEGADGTRILVDVGVRIRKLEGYLAERGIAPDSIAGIFMTHDHSDHVAGLAVQNPFAVKYGIPVWGTPGFWQGWSGAGRIPAELRRFIDMDPIAVGGLVVTPFAKPHDAPEPVSYLVAEADERLTVLTDLGRFPEELYPLLAGCHHYILEANYDHQMEIRSGRARELIFRVLGEEGHLSNDQCAAALVRLCAPQTRTVLLAHLSLDCNTRLLAHGTVAAALAGAGLGVPVEVAPAGEPSRWYGRGAEGLPQAAAR